MRTVFSGLRHIFWYPSRYILIFFFFGLTGDFFFAKMAAWKLYTREKKFKPTRGFKIVLTNFANCLSSLVPKSTNPSVHWTVRYMKIPESVESRWSGRIKDWSAWSSTHNYRFLKSCIGNIQCSWKLKLYLYSLKSYLGKSELGKLWLGKLWLGKM